MAGAGAPDASVVTPAPANLSGGSLLRLFQSEFFDAHMHMPIAFSMPGDAEYTALLLLSNGVTAARILGGTSASETLACPPATPRRSPSPGENGRNAAQQGSSKLR